jgi:hypothetical protein
LNGKLKIINEKMQADLQSVIVFIVVDIGLAKVEIMQSIGARSGAQKDPRKC